MTKRPTCLKKRKKKHNKTWNSIYKRVNGQRDTGQLAEISMPVFLICFGEEERQREREKKKKKKKDTFAPTGCPIVIMTVY
jgi:hypothetical protein